MPGLTTDTELNALRLATEHEITVVWHVFVIDSKKTGASGVTSLVDEACGIIPAEEFVFNPITFSTSYLFLQQEAEATSKIVNILNEYSNVKLI